MYLRYYLFLLCFFSYTSLWSATFTVTSILDSGTGTLRAAIDQANLDLTTKDSIVFNLGATETERTITLLSELPILNNVVIDGSTQINGIKFGVSDARIRITPANGLNISGFQIRDQVEIYGMEITGFELNNVHTGNGIVILGRANQGIIGAPGKGNVITGNQYGISGNFSNIKIQSNFIGIHNDGVTARGNSDGINFRFSALQIINAIIGGDTVAEGNLIGGNIAGIRLEGSLSGNGGAVTIINNSFATNKAETAQIPANSLMSVSLIGHIDLNVKNNVFGASVLGINTVRRNTINVQGNFFGTDRNKIVLPGTRGRNAIFGEQATVLTIGGTTPTDQNTFANYVNPISLNNAASALVVQNSFFNNLTVTIPENNRSSFRILEYRANRLSGKGTPGSTIQLYYTNRLSSNCNPETWFQNVITDAGGHWEYNGNLSGAVVASETIGTGTSGFEQANITLDDIIITPVACRAAPGKLEIKDPRSGDIFFQWTDENGIPYGNPGDQSIENLPAGVYRLTYGFRGGCATQSLTVTVPDEYNQTRITSNTLSSVTTHAFCNQPTGSVTGVITNATSFEWLDSSGQTVSRELDLLQKVPGFYRLVLKNVYGCSDTLAAFHIQTRNTPIAILNTEVITPDACNLGRGSITGITHNADGARFSWRNEAGVQISTSQDLLDVMAGRYFLTITNRGGCTETAEYAVTNNDASLPIPVIENKFVCSPTTITIAFTVDAPIYRIYNENGSLLQESAAKVFKLDIKNSASYYAAVARGTCESNRIPFTVTVGEASLNVPTSFSPNNDGVNDFWMLKGIEIYNSTNIKIFNRYGSIVYESNNSHTQPFDGKSKGAELPTGVYFYMIKLTPECDPFTGSVTIIR